MIHNRDLGDLLEALNILRKETLFSVINNIFGTKSNLIALRPVYLDSLAKLIQQFLSQTRCYQSFVQALITREFISV